NPVGVALPSASDAAAPTDFEAKPTVALSEFGLASGTLVKLRASAVDNCAEGGQTGTSRWLSFQVVTPEELFYEILMRQRAERTKFGQALTMAKSQSQTLDLPATAESAAALVRKHQLIARQAWQVANRLDATLV